MNNKQLIDFFDNNCTIQQQKFLIEFMTDYLNAGKKVKQAVIKILEIKLNELDKEKKDE